MGNFTPKFHAKFHDTFGREKRRNYSLPHFCKVAALTKRQNTYTKSPANPGTLSRTFVTVSSYSVGALLPEAHDFESDMRFETRDLKALAFRGLLRTLVG